MAQLQHWFTASTLITPFWIFLGALMGLHGLWGRPVPRNWHVAFLGGYICLAVLLIGGSWWSGAQQEAKNSFQQDKVDKQTSLLGKQTSLIHKLTHTDDTLSNEVNTLRDEITQMQSQAGRTANNMAERVATILSGRTISGVQAARFVATLRIGRASQIGINVVAGDAETSLYADRIVGLVKQAGWRVKEIKYTSYAGLPPRGLMIEIKDNNDNHTPPAANALLYSFETADIPIFESVIRNDPMTKTTLPVVLLVGINPSVVIGRAVGGHSPPPP